MNNKRYTRIMPILALMYMFTLFCRNNIGYAFGSMKGSFDLSPSVTGLAGGIFFIGYLLLQIPGGHFAVKFSAKKIIFVSIISYALVSIGMAFIKNSTQLLVLRFFLGVAQSVIYPTALLLVAKWFPLKERARAIGFWQLGAIISGFVIGPVSGYIIDRFSWQQLFVFEAIPALIWAVVWWFGVAETPEEAKFLSKQEREYLLEEFKRDREKLEKETVGKEGWKSALNNKFVWMLALVFFLNNMFNYGLSIWLPQVATGLTKASYTKIGMLTAIASGISVICMFLNSRHSDKTKERKWHSALVLIASGLSLSLSVLTIGNPYMSVGFILLAQGIWGGFSPVFWSIPSLIMSSAAIGAATGLINGIGNLGGFVGPYIFGYIIETTGSTKIGLAFIVIVQIAAGLILASLRHNNLKVKKENEELAKAV